MLPPLPAVRASTGDEDGASWMASERPPHQAATGAGEPCGICLSDFQAGDVLRSADGLHYFHQVGGYPLSAAWAALHTSSPPAPHCWLCHSYSLLTLSSSILADLSLPILRILFQFIPHLGVLSGLTIHACSHANKCPPTPHQSGVDTLH